MTISDFYDYAPAALGFLCFLVLCWIAWSCERETLPAPDERAIVKERLWRVRNDAWEVSPGHTRYQEE